MPKYIVLWNTKKTTRVESLRLFLHFSPFGVLFSQIHSFQFHFKKYTLSSAPSILVPSYNGRRQLVWCVHVRVDVYVDLTWQHLGADLGAMDLNADLRVYKYLIPAVGFLFLDDSSHFINDFYSYLVYLVYEFVFCCW